MLSRRSVRIKVMQLLYAAGKDETLNLNSLTVRYKNYGQKIRELFLFNLATFVDVANHSVRDSVARLAKLLPTDEDRNFEARLFENEILKAFISLKSYREALAEHAILGRLDIDFSRSAYNKFAETSAYKKYLLLEEPTPEQHQTVLLDLYRFLTQNEFFNERMEIFTEWFDDKSLITGASKKMLKALVQLLECYNAEHKLSDSYNSRPPFSTLGNNRLRELRIDYELYPLIKDIRFDFNEEDKASFEFGDKLLSAAYKNKDALIEIIKPLLQNWDIERVGSVEIVLLQLALAEHLYFPTIPPKVTINEYVDLSLIHI